MATMTGFPQHHAMQVADLDVLDAIASMPMRNGRGHPSSPGGFDQPPRKRNLNTLHALRRPPIDPIVLAASLSSGPHVTRHHFHHSFGPKVESKQMSRSQREKQKREEEERGAGAPDHSGRHRAGSYANCDREQMQDSQLKVASEERDPLPEAAAYPSRQGPRSQRLQREKEAKAAMERAKQRAEEKAGEVQAGRPDAMTRRPSEQINQVLHKRKEMLQAKQAPTPVLASAPSNALQSAATDVPTTSSLSSIVRPPPIHVRCYARTRIPTPHGEIFCHLYRNNRDSKEHLAFVVDTAQNAVGGGWESEAGTSKSIRSKTLDEVWGPHETEMERIVRGAYVGRLGPNCQVASQARRSVQTDEVESPLVRIHSECYTGETIGSQRCDCGEQLDEAIRLIHSDSRPARGVVVYLRQEGRGIGLLDKLMAYNLQDMGHDTVSANILLGHLADARKYDVAAEILRDLGVGSCRLLTNNPEKMEAMENEGITVEKRVAMVPRVWRHGHVYGKSSKRAKGRRRARGMEESIVSQLDDGPLGSNRLQEADRDDDGLSDEGSDSSRESYVDHVLRRSGATMVGSSVTRGPELEKYLRTKVQRMGHLLDVPIEQEQQPRREKSTRSPSSGPAPSSSPFSPHFDSDEGYPSADAPLTDEEPAMNEAQIRMLDRAEAAEHEDDDDEILIQSQ